MTTFYTTYKFDTDKESIERLQEVSKEKSSIGLKIENGLLIGSKEWFQAIENGLIEKHTLEGKITRVFMSGHNDFAEFEIECNGIISSWPRKGDDKDYIIGKRVELDYVIQKYKRAWKYIGTTTKFMIEIRIEK
jgi:hypothetical protein